ncbi:MAG: hypothetical protein ACLFM0_03385 [Spirochaetales bacterium]
MNRAKSLLPAIVLLVSCVAERPDPSLLRLDTDSEAHARTLLSSLTRTPVLAPEESVFPGLFEVSKVDVSTLALTARDPLALSSAQSSQPAPPWYRDADIATPTVPAARARRAQALADLLTMALSHNDPPQAQRAGRARCRAEARRNAYRLYFIDRAADERRGHAPAGAVRERIDVAGGSVTIARADESDPTLPASRAEIQRRLTHTAFSPCSLAETGPYRRSPADNPPESASADSGPLSTLPALVDIRVDGEHYARLARADTVRGDTDAGAGGSEAGTDPAAESAGGASARARTAAEAEDETAAASGRLYAAGTRYDLLVANANSSALSDSRMRARVLAEARRAASGLPPQAPDSFETAEGSVRLIEPPRAPRTMHAPDAAARAIETLGLEVARPAGASAGDGSEDPAGASAGDGSEDPAGASAGGRGENPAGDGSERADGGARAYRDALFSGDYDLARIFWETESAHDSEVLRMFRSFDPRNYASFTDDSFDALFEHRAAPGRRFGASEAAPGEPDRAPGEPQAPGESEGAPGKPQAPRVPKKAPGVPKKAPEVPGETAFRYLEDSGAVTVLGRDLHEVEWQLFTDSRDKSAEAIGRTVKSGLWLDAYGQLWFAR